MIDALAVNFQDTFDTWLRRIMFVLVPLCGLCVMAFTRSAHRHYPAHFHFSHFGSGWAGAASIHKATAATCPRR